MFGVRLLAIGSVVGAVYGALPGDVAETSPVALIGGSALGRDSSEPGHIVLAAHAADRWAAAANSGNSLATWQPRTVTPPSISRVEVLADGTLRVDGLGAPGTRVTLRRAGEALGATAVSGEGDWRIVTPRALEAGEHRFEAEAAEAGDGADSVTGSDVRIAIPADFRRDAIVAFEKSAADVAREREALADERRRRAEELAAAASERFSELSRQAGEQSSPGARTRLSQAQPRDPRASDATRGAGKSPDAGAAGFSFDALLLSVQEWLERANREYQREIVRRLQVPAPTPEQLAREEEAARRDRAKAAATGKALPSVANRDQRDTPPSASGADADGQRTSDAEREAQARARAEAEAMARRKAAADRLAEEKAAAEKAAAEKAAAERAAAEKAVAAKAAGERAAAAEKASAERAAEKAAAERADAERAAAQQEAQRRAEAEARRPEPKSVFDRDRYDAREARLLEQELAEKRRRQALAASRPQPIVVPSPKTSPAPVAPPPSNDAADSARERAEAPPLRRPPTARAREGSPAAAPPPAVRPRAVEAARNSSADADDEPSSRRVARSGDADDGTRVYGGGHEVNPNVRCWRRAGRRIRPPGTYTVASGDSLWRISQRHYRWGYLYPIIRRANPGRIADPDLIYPCQRLFLPRVRRR